MLTSLTFFGGFTFLTFYPTPEVRGCQYSFYTGSRLGGRDDKCGGRDDSAGAGMTVRGGGMTVRGGGMTVRGAGMTADVSKAGGVPFERRVV